LPLIGLRLRRWLWKLGFGGKNQRKSRRAASGEGGFENEKTDEVDSSLKMGLVGMLVCDELPSGSRAADARDRKRTAVKHAHRDGPQHDPVTAPGIRQAFFIQYRMRMWMTSRPRRSLAPARRRPHPPAVARVTVRVGRLQKPTSSGGPRWLAATGTLDEDPIGFGLRCGATDTAYKLRWCLSQKQAHEQVQTRRRPTTSATRRRLSLWKYREAGRDYATWGDRIARQAACTGRTRL